MARVQYESQMTDSRDDSLLASDTRDTQPEEFVQSLGDAQNLDPREEAFLGETLLAGQFGECGDYSSRKDIYAWLATYVE
ncbi:hypothetical protein CEP51_008437 [Fusarium floridanum]|uniref:Uncharacterized protein n=1 Tax=Fusarium floridanum TaxID=1325733 RepID=A0A428RKX1_9HYPO|nr:hypothetical protein CEP51_008437 [Fusarium floridanum]